MKESIVLDQKIISGSRLGKVFNFSGYRLLALIVTVLCFTVFVDAVFQQTQMILLGGRILFGNSVIRAALLITVVLGCILRPRLNIGAVPIWAWISCIGFLVIEAGYLISACGLPLGDVILSYYDYYFLLLIGPALLIFRGAVSEKVLVRFSVVLFIICAAVACAQHFTASPILYAESVDGSFQVRAWEFIGETRAFSFFGSAVEFGLFCAFCGALGGALLRTMPKRGTLLMIASALACYTTLTRLCYLIFLCACLHSLVLTFGSGPKRGRWHPFLFFISGIGTIIVGVTSFTSGETNKLQDAGSIFMRLDQWAFYYNMLLHSSLAHRMFGLGIVQNESMVRELPMIIDNALLALVLHIGVVGLLFFGVLLTKMWLYLRCEALESQQPFVIAATSLWATFLCAGLYNILFGLFGIVFGLVVICERKICRRVPTNFATLA